MVVEQFVFGYGSLAGLRGRPAQLRGYRRLWGAAMDNSVTIAGYKYYRLREDGSRPQVHVAFLDIAEEARAATGGLLIAVDDSMLRALDARERNYDRIDVTAAVPRAPGTVWAYRGSAAGRERLRIARERGRAVVALQYYVAARGLFDLHEIGPEGLDGLPLLDLERVDVPPDPQP